MNPELEALIRAYDATMQAAPDQVARLRAIYDSKLDQVMERCPRLSRQALEGMVRLARNRWLKSHEKPTTLPPRA
jgi:ribosomal 50S subunit-associated protein YjgA (DUF615 family)